MLRGFHWGNLRTKIIAWSFIPTVIILAAAALVVYLAYQRLAEELVLGRDRELAYFSAAQIKDDLASYSDVLLAVARTPDLRSNDKMRQQASLGEAGSRLAYFDAGVVVLDTFGKVVATEPSRADISGQDWSDRAYFRQILLSRKAIFSDVLPDGPQNTPVVVSAVPVIGNQDEFLGVIAGMFQIGPTSYNPFYGSIAKVRTEQSGRIYLVDGNRTVIYHSTPDYIGDAFNDRPDIQQVLAGNIGSIRLRDMDNRDVVTAYAPVPGTTWGLILEDDWGLLSRSEERYGLFLLILLAAGIALPALVVSIGVRRITEPIQGLIAVAQQVAEGNFGLTIDAQTGDEIEDLAQQFNRMSAELQESYSGLEKKVAARTKELAAHYEVTAAASSSLDLDTVLERSLDQVLKVMNLEVGAIHLLDKDNQILELAVARGIQERDVQEVQLVTLGDGLASYVIEKGKPLLIPNITEASRPLRVVPAGENQAYVGVPVETRGQMLGVLSLVGEPGRRFRHEEVALLASIADEIALAVDNARLYAHAEQLAVMEERSRLARELHDSVTQLLYSLTLFAEAGQRMNKAGDHERTEQFLARVNETARQAHKEMRLLIYELRPPTVEKEGLVGALQHRLDAVEKRSGLETQLQVEGEIELPALLEDGLFRVAVEALNNALKHAAATQVSVQIQACIHSVKLQVVDNGNGFDVDGVNNAGGSGLPNMRERVEKMGGSFEITSEPGAGTQVVVEIEKELT
ncbi:MAG TPA: cache domain-containing protein [Anaerolineales bacterium]